MGHLLILVIVQQSCIEYIVFNSYSTSREIVYDFFILSNGHDKSTVVLLPTQLPIFYKKTLLLEVRIRHRSVAILEVVCGLGK